MKSLTAVLPALLLLAGSLFAQHRTFGSASGFGNVVFPGTGRAPANPSVSGFGNVVWPGTGRPPLARPPFSITDPTFASGLHNTVSGRVPFGAGVRGRGSRQPFVYVPFAYPVYAGMDPYFQQQQQPNVTVVYPPPQPPVVINQSFAPAQPSIQEVAPPDSGVSNIKVYQAPTRSPEEMADAAAQSAPYYLIAFKDHSIYSAVAYWIDGDTLHYFTSGNNHNQVSMSLVDRELTERLNRERKVDVRLPK